MDRGGILPGRSTNCGQPRPWVARIKWDPELRRLHRDFQRGDKDYSEANSVGSRGVFLYFAIEPGLYEVFSLPAWRKTRREFLLVENEDHTRKLTQAEATAWAKENC